MPMRTLAWAGANGKVSKLRAARKRMRFPHMIDVPPFTGFEGSLVYPALSRSADYAVDL
jgi:hypothetical protein